MEDGEFLLLDLELKEVIDRDLDDINMWIYIKDKFNIFNEVWYELVMKCKDMLIKYKIVKYINELNFNWRFIVIFGEVEGI